MRPVVREAVYNCSSLDAIRGLAPLTFDHGHQVALVVKNLPMQVDIEDGFHSWVREICWRRAWQSTPVFLPGESYRQRSLTGYSPWGHIELDMTEATEHVLLNLRDPIKQGK